jgi:hypothetical protein
MHDGILTLSGGIETAKFANRAKINLRFALRLKETRWHFRPQRFIDSAL